ncbi:deazaflavin-dependent oxidoreductase (nitroreductase family) [Mycolicibacterium sp. BK556]|uniref:nitroreductase/quinone reductase family protein n=1 Tax=unclassified Mycolicibacterium TaxID=2636767 RepID=UPI000D4847C9|nr:MULTISPECIES: nitroreductase/quinone reductase family protein [unclassified Mycolicibacterium]MBB3606594.1 deazaflavin-dependent oxidoreductase (nitroreductase family) [Mycolicibacterium sp. BK556]MBB3636159.1 deazaflavin-dependent oxidoreductase (nitroreductase family) [Mycolicibacterium sp. BK607]MBB3753820.1 deazaflavin-dependent oxidoreductase (nitroreductase family) [Mycolicibacterium sp. BK634]
METCWHLQLLDDKKSKQEERQMNDASAAAIRAGRGNWATEHRQMYLDSGGTRGHIMDISDVGGHTLTTHCLLKTSGRRSGRTFINPLIYGTFAGEVVIVASKGGADRHPDWYLNIRAHKYVEFQIATQAFRASWREPEGIERKAVWRYMVSIFPPYSAYQESTDRAIPLVLMHALEPTDSFGV